LWSRTFELPFSIAPKLDRGGGIIFALENNEVYRIDAFGNAHMWVLSNAPVLLLSVEQQRIIALYADGTMESLGSPEDWYISVQGEVHSSPLPRLPAEPLAAAGRGNNAAILLNDGRITFVSMEERSILWTGDSHIRVIMNNGGRAETEAEMVFDERGIYVLDRSGATCFSHEGGRLWFTFLQNAAAIPAFGDDGVLYSGGRDWILYAYKIEDRILPERNNLYGPAPEGSYGIGRPQSIYMGDFPINELEKRNKLEQIGAAINSGTIGANEPAWTTFLLTVSAGQDHILLRIGALNLLGKIGSQETIPWLVNIFRRENEPSVRAAAVTAIGDIGVDPHGAAIQTFLYLLIQGGGIKDEQVLIAIAAATGALCRFSGPPLSETGVRILNLLSAGSQPPIVRRQAGRELASLR
jgi:outer membrane protein assembly factor BamB